MFSYRSIAAALIAATLSGAAISGTAMAAPPVDPIKPLDWNGDGALNLWEAKTAAGKAFSRLDTDRNGTVEAAQLKGRVTPAEIAAADYNKDGQINLVEYLRIVEQRFRAANPDNDWTVDAREMQTPAGRALLVLLR